jgi:hypothetical protein
MKQTTSCASDRAALLRYAIAVLANSADSAIGMTILFPDGTCTYLSRATADAVAGTADPEGRA